MSTTDPKTGFVLYTFAEIVDRVRGDFDAEGLSYSRVAKSLVYPFVYVLAGVSYLLQGRIAWGVRQSFVDLAALVNVRRWGRLTGKPYVAASQATTTWTFTGVSGTDIPAGTEFVLSNGETWTTDALGTVGGGGTVTIACTSVNATDDANVTSGDTATLTTPIADVSSTVTAAADATDGSDDETKENHVERILESFAEPNQWSGSAADWRECVRGALANVDSVGVLHPSDNVVSIWFTMDPGYGTGGGVIPTAQNVSDVQYAIDAADAYGHSTRRAVTAAVTAYAPTATATALTVAVDGGATADQETAIENAVDDMLRRRSSAALTLGYAYDVPHELWITAIQNALGSDVGFNMTAPAGDVSATAGQVVTRGVTTIT